MLLIDDILLLPYKGLVGIFEKIHEMAKKEVSDEKYTLEKLMELQLRYELDEISEEEYEKEEAKLQTKLNAIRESFKE
ncbi:MAG: gas vesicle protein GvpG [candidate division Zixibacteria bacterium]|nr:gas vesicle protein GvpG [candidate division Zixibacteria bacterium]